MWTLLVSGFAVLITGTTFDPVHAQANTGAMTTEGEARVFMQQYEEDLRLHRREALAARYSLRGSYFPSRSSSKVVSIEAISALYHNSSQWTGPEIFEWRDLSYEVSGPDAVVVVGSFLWQDPTESEASAYSYSNLLVREDGRLRIRLEHEAPQVGEKSAITDISDEDAIRAIRKMSNQALASRDISALKSTWLSTLHITTSSGDVISSGDEMVSAFSEVFSDPNFITYVRTTKDVNLSPGKSYAAESGEWVGRWKDGDGEISISGVYIAQWHKITEGWRIRSELFVALSCEGSEECQSLP
jgi:hypothetical protein